MRAQLFCILVCSSE